MGFQYFRNRHGDLCPICMGERGKPDCRKSDQGLYFCRGPEAHDGRYRFIGWDTNGFGMFLTADAYARRSDNSDVYQREQLARQAQLAAERQAKLAQLPSIEDRDHHFRRISCSAGLGSRHRQHLREKRGLTDQLIDHAIEQGLFWTWPDNADIPLLPLNLPGVDPSSGRLRYLQRGLAIAVPDALGNITGVQIRPDFGGKYFWVSSDTDKLPIPGSGPQLPNGELPIAVHRIEGSQSVGLCDSVSLKPFLAAQHLQTTFIGAAGSNFASSPDALREALEALQPEQVILYPDAGDTSNPSVNKAIEKTIALLQDWGYPIKVAWWGQHDYDNDPDIDEIPVALLHIIELLNPETYLGMSQAILEDQRQHEYQQLALKTWKKSRQFTPTQTVHQRYLSLSSENVSNSGICAIKSPMGTGKTEWLRQYFKTVDTGAVAIGYRNSLLLQSCERWPHFYHLHSDAAFDLVKDPHSRIACCLDSLGRFEDRDFDGKVLILDESLSIVLHGLISGTLTGKRDQCLAKLKAAIQRAKVVLPMDGNNTDVVVDYIAKLRDGGTVHKILNTYQRKQLQIELLDTVTAEGKSIDERSPLMELALTTLTALDLAPEGTARSIVLFSDSQRQCQIAEEMFEERGYSSLRVDSKTSATQEVKAFLKDPDRYLQETQPRVLIYSPTAESGLSVGIQDYFYKGFGLFFGVLPISSMTQMMQRVRDLNSMAIWCKKRAFSLEESGIRSVLPRRLQQWMTDYIQADALATLQGSDREEAAKQWVQALLQAYDDPHLMTHNILAAAINYERSHTRDCLKVALQEAGHRVTIIQQLQSYLLKDEARDLRVQILESDANAIFAAKDILLSQAIQIKSRWRSSLDERWACEKALLKHRLPGIELSEVWSPDLILKLLFKDRSLLPSLERWWLLNHMSAAKERSRQRWEWLMDQTNSPFLPDIRSDYALLQTLERIDILKLFEAEQALDETSPLIQNVIRDCKQRRNAISLKRTVGKQRPMEFIGRLIRLIGGSTQSKQHWNRDESRGKRQYQFIAPAQANPVCQAILSCINTRLSQYCPEPTESQAEIAIEVATPKPKNINILPEGVAELVSKLDSLKTQSLASIPELVKVGDIIRRTVDGARFMVDRLVHQQVWVRWLDTGVPLVPIPLSLNDCVLDIENQTMMAKLLKRLELLDGNQT